MKSKQKLMLKKEKIASLSNDQMNNVNGGKITPTETTGSTQNDFTCTWCTTVASKYLSTCGNIGIN